MYVVLWHHSLCMAVLLNKGQSGQLEVLAKTDFNLPNLIFSVSLLLSKFVTSLSSEQNAIATDKITCQTC